MLRRVLDALRRMVSLPAMSSRWKKILTILVSVTTACMGGWLVKAGYDHGNVWLPAVLRLASVIAQVVIALIQSQEEKEIADLRQKVEEFRREREIWYRVELSKAEKKLAIAEQQITEIKRGNRAGVVEWAEVEKQI